MFEDVDNLLLYNLYAYCYNNPTNLIDQLGESPANIIGAIVGGLAGAALGALLAKELGLKGAKRAALIAAATIGGAVLGAFLGPYIAKLGSKVISMAKKAGAYVQAARVKIKQSRTVAKLIKNVRSLKKTKTVRSHISSRPYTNCTLIIKNIMEAAKPVADESLAHGLKWVVNGSFNGKSGVWELVIDTATNTIVHFLFRSK